MKYLVVGGGLSGLVAAHAILDSNLSGNITIIEKSSSLGGLLAGKMYPKQNLYFDIGTHIFQETGQSEIDKFLLNAVTPKDLIHFPVGKGDLAGVVVKGKLQNNSQRNNYGSNCKRCYTEQHHFIIDHIDRLFLDKKSVQAWDIIDISSGISIKDFWCRIPLFT